jgi:tetraprenyl-beta-curcumene synthase
LVAREVAQWRSIAATIPNAALRRDALRGLACKRANIDGAALFWTLSRVRSPGLLRLLVAYEILADYLDCISERAAANGIANGLQLHRALIDAIDPCAAPVDYYQYHLCSNDGGYLRTLLDTCRQACSELPSYKTVRPWLLEAARLTQVLALNHEPDPWRRDAALREWAQAHSPDQRDLAWWERAGGASAWLTVLALLALGAEPACTEEQAHCVYVAYLPWISLVGTLLDSYGDMAEDAGNEDHSYVAHYASLFTFLHRAGVLIQRALHETSGLLHGERHTVIVSCMIAMYLSKDSTRSTRLRDTTTHIARAGGALTLLLLPVLRAWRVIYDQRSI